MFLRSISHFLWEINLSEVRMTNVRTIGRVFELVNYEVSMSG